MPTLIQSLIAASGRSPERYRAQIVASNGASVSDATALNPQSAAYFAIRGALASDPIAACALAATYLSARDARAIQLAAACTYGVQS